MNNELVSKLVHKASQLGAKGVEVIGWIPPQSGASDPDGVLVTKQPELISGGDTPWYDK